MATDMARKPRGNPRSGVASQQRANVDDVERWISGISGAALALYGLRRRSIAGAALAVLGAGLVYRTRHWISD
jgi:uncharacterized membrane protein